MPTVLVAIVAIGLALAWVLSRPGTSTHHPPGAGGKLAWAPPKLVHPKTVKASPSARMLQLDPKRDYVVKMPSSPLVGGGGLTISGGHNVVLIGGSIVVPPQGQTASGEVRRGLFLKGQTGTIHVEGLRIGGRGLAEGIDLDQRLGATVQIENVRVEGLHARDEVHFTDNHDDVIQTWAGPARLRVDHLTGHTDYQGLFLNPEQFPPHRRPTLFDLRHVNIIGGRSAGFLLWQTNPFPLHLSQVWVRPARGRGPKLSLWPSPRAWRGVRLGVPRGGDFVPPGGVGPGYRSPGYMG